MRIVAPAGRGRLSAEREAEVYRAVLDEVETAGYDRFSYDAVAARAHCSKATHYRLWDDKADLVAQALQCDPGLAADDRDCGSLAADLHAWAESTTHDTGRLARILLAVARACHDDPQLATTVRERILGEPCEDEGDGLSRALARGELSETNPALPFLLTSMAGLLGFHELITGQPVTPAVVGDYLDAVVLPALRAGNRPAPATG